MAHIDQIYDVETYPNCFTCTFTSVDNDDEWIYEISDYLNDSQALLNHLMWLMQSEGRLIGFNNNSFDYTIIHQIILRNGDVDAMFLYQLAQAIISGDGFSHLIWDDKKYIPQIDLYKIHHFDNKNKSTSLKAIEFVLRMESVEDLPFPVGTILTYEQVQVLRGYNKHDNKATKEFYFYTLPAIKFRELLSEKHGRSFMNFNDTKIGKDIFIHQLEANGIPCYSRATGKREPIQTLRPTIALNDAVFDWIEFTHPELKRIKSWFQQQVIRETKGVFKDVTATVDGFKFVFGLGGLHGSVNNARVIADDEYAIVDIDVASYYPRLAAVNGLYPEHLSKEFCTIFDDLFRQRREHKKGTPENAMLKLALNGVYGDSNSTYSPFYDPLYTMQTTINGQLLLCSLAEELLQLKSVTMIQANTDGITVRIKRSEIAILKLICQWWEKLTGLELERADYSAMYIKDVNNYLAVDESGAVVKRKGAYGWKVNLDNINIGAGDLGWDMNHGALIVPRTAEYLLTDGMMSAEELITSHDNLYDFCLRAKIPRSSRLIARDVNQEIYALQNFTRYYISQGGYDLIKIMPPLKGKADERHFNLDVGWKAQPCNDITQANLPINYDYYIQKTLDLVEPLKRMV